MQALVLPGTWTVHPEGTTDVEGQGDELLGEAVAVRGQHERGVRDGAHLLDHVRV